VGGVPVLVPVVVEGSLGGVAGVGVAVAVVLVLVALVAASNPRPTGADLRALPLCFGAGCGWMRKWNGREGGGGKKMRRSHIIFLSTSLVVLESVSQQAWVDIPTEIARGGAARPHATHD
jgi:hypothetical protein